MPISFSELCDLSLNPVTSPLSQETLRAALSTAPFITTDPDYFVNTRDLGLLPTSPIAPGRILRSAALDRFAANPEVFPPHVRRVFDLRSDGERRNFGVDPVFPGVENVWIDTRAPRAKGVDLALYVDGYGEAGLCDQYLGILSLHQPVIRSILEHVRDKPDEPFLFHCTAGRDRTGVISGLLLHLAGASPDIIRKDYLLSRIGTESNRETLHALAQLVAGAASEDAPGFLNFCALHPACWDFFVAGVDTKYGGWDGYVVRELGFSDDDLSKIKENLKA